MVKASKSNSLKVFSILLILFFLLVISIGTYKYLSNPPSQKKIQQQNQKSYTDNKYDFSFKYPSSWNLKTEYDWLYFVSPDYKTTGEREFVVSGYLLEVKIFTAENAGGRISSFSSNLKSAKEAVGEIGGNYKIVKVDGIDTVVSDLKTHGSYINASVFKNQKEYFFRLNAINEDEPEVIELFDSILSSIRIE